MDLICEQCDIPVGFKARGIIEKPEGRNEKWLDEHCWGCGRSEANVEAAQAPSSPATSLKNRAKEVEVYVCPEPECGNYYGTNAMPELGEQFTGPKLDDQSKLESVTGSRYRHSRAACPDCRMRGKSVERVRVKARVAIPPSKDLPKTPSLPGSTAVAAQ